MINNLDNSVYLSKSNNELREKIILEYKPFIRAVTKKTFNRYMDYAHDDELSIALIAFNEAIDSYQPEKGHFLPFSAWVIKRRLIDYIRKNKTDYTTISIDQVESSENNIQISSIDHLAVLEYKESVISEFRRYEIQEYIKMLQQYNITLEEMYKTSPKHNQTKKIITKTMSYILSKENIISDIKEKKILPLKHLAKELEIPRKTLERARKYIMGVLLLRTEDFTYLNGFIRWEKK